MNNSSRTRTINMFTFRIKKKRLVKTVIFTFYLSNGILDMPIIGPSIDVLVNLTEKRLFFAVTVVIKQYNPAYSGSGLLD